MTKKQKIDCEVESCKHCDCAKHECELKEIKISEDSSHADSKLDTICESFDKRED